jgi:pseudaminic acid synthase
MIKTKSDFNRIFTNKKSDICIVAELSANHNGSLAVAKDTIKAAADCGVDAIKIQTYTPDTITLNCNKKDFQIIQGTIWDGITLYKLYKTAYTPWEWHEELFKTADKCGLLCFSTPFDKTAVDFLERFNPIAYKIASFEADDYPLIEYVAKKKRPMIVSTGLSDFNEMKDIVSICKRAKNDRIMLLKCTSAYPAKLEDMNLKTIKDMHKRLKVNVGLSDHTLGMESACISVAFGAKLIEKHFILKRSVGGPDSEFSMEPKEMTQLVKAVRNAQKTVGEVRYSLSAHLKKNISFKRSLYANADIEKGEMFTQKNVRSVRPGYGLHPKHLSKIFGKKAARDIKFGTALRENLIEGFKKGK